MYYTIKPSFTEPAEGSVELLKEKFIPPIFVSVIAKTEHILEPLPEIV